MFVIGEIIWPLRLFITKLQQRKRIRKLQKQLSSKHCSFSTFIRGFLQKHKNRMENITSSVHWLDENLLPETNRDDLLETPGRKVRRRGEKKTGRTNRNNKS